jgi:hypothetical protein
MATVQVDAQWALFERREHRDYGGRERQGYGIIASSEGLEADRFTEFFQHYLIPEERLPGLRQAAIVPFPGLVEPQIAIAIHDWERGGGGRSSPLTSCYIVPFHQIARWRLSYASLIEGFGAIRLPRPGLESTSEKFPIVVGNVEVEPRYPDRPPAGRAIYAAVMILDSNVCIVGADEMPYEERIRFIDDVARLLPFGMRNWLPVATYGDGYKREFGLYFSDGEYPSDFPTFRPDGLRLLDWRHELPSSNVLSSLAESSRLSPLARSYLKWLGRSTSVRIDELARMTEEGYSREDLTSLIRHIIDRAWPESDGPEDEPVTRSVEQAPEEQDRRVAAIADRHDNDLRDLTTAAGKLDALSAILPDDARGTQLKEVAAETARSARAAAADAPAFHEAIAQPGRNVDALEATAAQTANLASQSAQSLEEAKAAILAYYQAERRRLAAASRELGKEAAILPGKGTGGRLKRWVEQVHAEATAAMASSPEFKTELAKADPDINALLSMVSQLSSVAERAGELLNGVSAELSRFLVYLSYPRCLSAGHSSPFVVQVYPSRRRRFAAAEAAKRFDGIDYTRKEGQLESTSMTVQVKLSSPVMVFSPPVVRTISVHGSDIDFTGEPIDSVSPGKHTGLLSISDEKGEVQFMTLAFNMTIFDYAFDHMSRPIVGRATGVVLGLISLSFFVLGLLTQTARITETVSGAFGTLLAGFIFARINSQYRTTAISAKAAGEDADQPGA